MVFHNRPIVDISYYEESNPFVFHLLDRWRRQAQSLLEILPTIESNRTPKKTEFHYLAALDFNMSCVDKEDAFHIGFNISAVLRVFDLFTNIVNRERYLKGILPRSGFRLQPKGPFSPLVYDHLTIQTFPREAPLTAAHTESAIRLTFTALEFTLWHELTHLWDGHGPYRKWRKDSGRPLSYIESRSLEWEADRLAISRIILMYRSGEHAVPLAKVMASALGGAQAEDLFNGTIENPRTYIRYVLFVLFIFFWHFDERVDERYLEKTHSYASARAFYVSSDLCRILAHWPYAHWAITQEEYLNGLIPPTIEQAIDCWDDMTGEAKGTENFSSPFKQPYALRDLKRFEENSQRLEKDIRKHGFRI